MTDEPRNPEGEPVRATRWHESVERFLTNNLLKLLTLALIGLGLGWYFGVEVPTQPPRWATTIFWTAVLGSPVAFILATKVVDYLYDPLGVILLDIDATDTDVAVYNFPEKRWREVQVLEGDLHRLDATQTVYAGKNFDPEAMTVEGTWRGSLSDFELLQEQARVTKLRNRLEDQAKRGFAIESHAWIIVRTATREAVRSVTQTFEEGTLPNDGTAINDEIDAAIDGFDFGTLDETGVDADEADAVEEAIDRTTEKTVDEIKPEENQ